MDFSELLQIQLLNFVFIFHLGLHMRTVYHPKQTVLYFSIPAQTASQLLSRFN